MVIESGLIRLKLSEKADFDEDIETRNVYARGERESTSRHRGRPGADEIETEKLLADSE